MHAQVKFVPLALSKPAVHMAALLIAVSVPCPSGEWDPTRCPFLFLLLRIPIWCLVNQRCWASLAHCLFFPLVLPPCRAAAQRPGLLLAFRSSVQKAAGSEQRGPQVLKCCMPFFLCRQRLHTLSLVGHHLHVVCSCRHACIITSSAHSLMPRRPGMPIILVMNLEHDHGF
jgi:hypothetical protein